MRSVEPWYSTFMPLNYRGRIADEMKMSFRIWRKKNGLIIAFFFFGTTISHWMFGLKPERMIHYRIIVRVIVIIEFIDTLGKDLDLDLKMLSIDFMSLWSWASYWLRYVCCRYFLVSMSMVGGKLLQEE